MTAALYRLRAYRQREDGAIVYLGLVVFMVILLVSGLAIDMARHEAERMRFQTTADRAVLAATLMRNAPDEVTEETNSFDPLELAQAYFAAEGLAAAAAGRIEVHNVEGEGRTVRATPSALLNTYFMRWSGQSTLNLTADSAATHGRGITQIEGGGGTGGEHMEVVLVLDVSTSMSGSGRIQNLKIAASQLAESLLGGTTTGTTGLSIFTYADYVVPPVGMINAFPNVSGASGSCMDFTNFSEFLGSYDQVMLRHQCQTSETRRAQLYLRDAEEAVDFINNMELKKGTSIDQGVRFGAMMFDPSIQPVISHLINLGVVDEVFEGRPHGVTPNGPTQALVLMTDGRNNPNGDRPGTRDQYNANTLATCSALKTAGVVVYTVAFHAPSDAQELMAECASSPNHYFNTSGEELIAAFETIGTHLYTEEVYRTLQLIK